MEQPTPRSLNWPEHFKPCEFGKSGGRQQIIPDELQPKAWYLAHQLYQIRIAVNEKLNPSKPIPLITLSGYRSPAYNLSVGSRATSRHPLMMASDFFMPNVEEQLIYDLAIVLIENNIICEGGLGIYDDMIHYDFRGTRARWDWR